MSRVERWILAGTVYVAGILCFSQEVASQLGLLPAQETWKAPVGVLLLLVGRLVMQSRPSA